MLIIQVDNVEVLTIKGVLKYPKLESSTNASHFLLAESSLRRFLPGKDVLFLYV